jgi:hypothetical protein
MLIILWYNIKHIEQMTSGIMLVVDVKTTFMMLWKPFPLSLKTKPLWTLASLNRKDFIFYSMCVTSYTSNVMNFLIEVIIIRGWSHWILLNASTFICLSPSQCNILKLKSCNISIHLPLLPCAFDIVVNHSNGFLSIHRMKWFLRRYCLKCIISHISA